jgi:Protein ChrB, N-terminal
MASKRVSWVLLAYRLPRLPSTPRSALWRKLRRLGAAQLLDGLVASPLDARTREQLEWLADEVIESEGEATIWVAELALFAQERELANRTRTRSPRTTKRFWPRPKQPVTSPRGVVGGRSAVSAESCDEFGRATTSHRRSASWRSRRSASWRRS